MGGTFPANAIYPVEQKFENHGCIEGGETVKNHTIGIAISAVPYYKDLNNYTGSVIATILMTQLEYWFSKMKGEMFYKFLEPCEQKGYKEGDSWVEELGFSKAEFRTAFAKIGKTYKSKNEYLNSQDQFGDKLYLSYYDRVERQTYYIRNHDKADEIMEKLISKKSIILTSRDEESGLLEVENSTMGKSGKLISRSEESGFPITEDYNRRLQQKTTAEDYAEDSASNSGELIVPMQKTNADQLKVKDIDAGKNTDVITAKKIVELFNLMCPSLPKVQVLSDYRKKAIKNLGKSVSRDISFYEILFQKIEMSDFLCGRSGKWKAGFDWVIKQGNVIKIMEGNYDNHAASTGRTGGAHSLTDQLTSQTVQDFINN